MKKEQRQSYYDLIEQAAQVQKQELCWVSNLYKKRLLDLQTQHEAYENWKTSS